MTIDKAKQKVISVAVSNLGYHEVGNNQTKFAEGTWDNQFYGWELNGQPWCDVYADYCYCYPFGIAKGKLLTYQVGGGSALCSTSALYYKNNNAWYNYPEPGDQAFFYYNGAINHTGIVEDVQGSGADWTSFTCIEGNSSDMVARRTYYRGNNVIAGFGRPNWKVVVDDNSSIESPSTSTSQVTTPTHTQTMIVTRYGEKSNAVKDLQEKLIKLGYDVGKDGADGEFGRNTLAAVRKFQKEHNLVADGQVGDLTRAALETALKNNSNNTDSTQDNKNESTSETLFKKGDKVTVKNGSTWYNSKIYVPQFVLNDVWIIYSIFGDRAVINKNISGTKAIMSPININNLIKI